MVVVFGGRDERVKVVDLPMVAMRFPRTWMAPLRRTSRRELMVMMVPFRYNVEGGR